VSWKTIKEDGREWEVRAVGRAAGELGEMLEFRTTEGSLPPRRVAVETGALERMNEEELRSAYRRARPIGADHYGRPGKTMLDMGQSG
jgi:hypothetical protein